MNRKEIISAIVLLSFAAFIGYNAGRYPFGSLSRIGPGFFPFYLSMALAAVSLVILTKTILNPAKDVSTPAGFLTKEKALRVALLLTLVIVYLWSMGRLGFPIATFLFILALFKFVESFSWTSSVLGALAISIGNYLLFGVWLQCQFPKGWLGGLMGG